MIANYENRFFKDKEEVWLSRYKNLHSILHWHNGCEIMYVEQGNATIMIDEKNYNAKSGDAFICESNNLHYITATPNSIMSIIVISEKILSDFYNTSLCSAQLINTYDINKFYKLLKGELENKCPFYTQKIRSAVLNLFADIYRNEKTVAKSKPINERRKYAELLQKINEEYQTLCFEDAAKFTGYSKSHFSKTFKKLSGISFSEYLNIIKTEKAVEILQSTAAKQYLMSDIASMCGFSTIRNFNRVFKTVTGYSPKDIPQGFVLNQVIKTHSSNEFNPTQAVTTVII